MLKGPKIIIIGAGAAGISAASRLIEKGLENITILEGKDRIGGRIHTVEFSDNVVDLGAQWVHGEHGNVVFNLASPHKLLDSSVCYNQFDKHVFVNAKGEVFPKAEGIETLKIYYNISESISDAVHDAESYGEYFENQFYQIYNENPFTTREKAEQLLGWMQKFDNSLQSSDSWFDVSAKKITDYWACEGDLLLNWKDRGYRTLFDLLSKIPSAEGESAIMTKVELNKDVVNINYILNDDIIVKAKDGSEYTASHVIFTPSLGVLKEKHAALFTPLLPEAKQNAIKGLNIGTVNKVLLEFPHRWWQEDCAGFSLIWSKEDREEFIKSHGQEREWLCDVFAFISVDYQPRVLCAWISGKFSKEIESLSDNDVSDGLCLLLELFLSKAYNIPKFDRMLRSSWYTDEHFRGSYSFKSITTEKLNAKTEDLAEPIVTIDGKPIILFAGEATHEHYYSTVHGAVETGFRAADKIIDFHRTQGWLKRMVNGFDKMERSVNGSNELTTKTKLVIVGAGIAGLAAAKTLEDAEFKDYLLIEAQIDIGGRIQSLPWKKVWIESGAQFVHGARSQLAQLCYQHNLLSDTQCKDGQGVFLRNDGREIDEALVEEIDDFIRDTLEQYEEYENRNIEAGCENIGALLRKSFDEYLHERNDPLPIRNIKEEIFDWNVKFIAIDNACYTLDVLSTKYWGQFRFTGGPEHLAFKTCYKALPKLIADSLDEKNLRLNTSVDSIEWQQMKNNDPFLVLKLSDNTRIIADCVIITCSLGYLKENYKKMFIPSLPTRYCEAIDCLGFGLINKIFLDFDVPWWKPGTKGFQFLWKQEEFSNNKLAAWTKDLTGFDVLPNHEGVLLGWISGRGAYIIEALSERQIATDCENLLKHYLKLDNIPRVERCFRTQWNANKYVRGSYSHITTKCDANGITPKNLSEPIWGKRLGESGSKDVPMIMLAGEATHETYYSTTHGAYDTGVKQAQIYLQYHVTNH
ncbi:uncharacterized protein LOC108630773 isoform X2 [Ceratina calcarata]|uniref:Uncharacterized protein LOC108630773 isoform X2 n=1 Tax=Ceratina calcarata TaxID=156304 RepID=A0AAJ7WG76_9HYME|nr:uncharacterized protein LOC108630773 isoform X2 [Ceratina calcarata]